MNISDINISVKLNKIDSGGRPLRYSTFFTSLARSNSEYQDPLSLEPDDNVIKI